MANHARTQTIIIRVNDAEKKMIEERMTLAKINTISGYIRKISIDGYVLSLDLSDISQLVRLLRNATNNLNQIARRVNETNNIYKADIEDIQENYEKLWQTAEGILKELTKIS